MARGLSLVLLLVLLQPVSAQEPSFNGRTLSEWQTMLKEDTVPRKRRAAVVALGQIAATYKDTLPTVLLQVSKALRSDPAATVREQAAILLTQQKVDENLVATLQDLVESIRIEREANVKQKVVSLLGRFGPLAKTAVTPLIASLKDTDASVRAATADALGRIGADAKLAGPVLLGLVDDKENSVRLASIFALGRISPDEPAKVAEALLIKATKDAEKSIRQEAVISLGFLGYKSEAVVKGIVSRLEEPDADFRAAVALTLVKFGSSLKPAQVELSRAFREDSDKFVRQNLVRVLTLAAGENRAEVIQLFAEQLGRDQDFEVRIAIAEELGTFGMAAKSAIPALRAAQRDSQIKVRESATNAIKAINKPAAPAKP